MTVTGSEAELDAREEAIRLLNAADLADDVRQLAIDALPPPLAASEPAAPIGDLYLRRLRVQGFRGIGPRVELELDPRPGLTVVVGRNGSGKSSLAEALELLLTDENHRWKGRTKVWREGWRNLHAPAGALVEAAFALGGTGDEVVIRRRWADDVERVEDATVEVRDVDGSPTTLDALGWPRFLRQMRPFLPYTELGAMFDELRAIYDAIAPILGLGELEDAWRALRQRRLDAERAQKALRARRRELAEHAAGLDDPRAQTLARLLARRTIDEAELDALLDGDAPDGGAIEARRRLAVAEVPSEKQAHAALARHAQASAKRAGLARTSAGRERELADLIAAAVTYRTGRPDERCPVCGTDGVLDERWLRDAERRVAELRARAGTLDAVEREERDAADAVAELVRGVASLRDPAERSGADVDPLTTALAAWEAAWDDGAGEHAGARAALTALLAAARRLRDAAAEAERAHDAQWRPLAEDVAAWRGEWRACAAAPPVARLRASEDALGAALAELRRRRLAPLEDGMRAAWEGLRQQSNVSLQGIELVRRGDLRTAQIDVRVDDSDTAALAVLSQGELNALALSVFLPRATLQQSPFRFAIIDDPVQAMDPAKVDGLARVLHRHGERRQVVVFTHDTRLPEALLRLGLDAQIVQVKRDLCSVVRLRPGRDLIVRYVDDARVCARDQDLEPDVRMRVSLALCRSAVDLAAERAVWRRRLHARIPHDAVAAELDRCRGTKDKVAAALKRHADDDVNLFRELHDRFGADAVTTVRQVTGGIHGSIDAALDLAAAIEGTRRLVRHLATLEDR